MSETEMGVVILMIENHNFDFFIDMNEKKIKSINVKNEFDQSLLTTLCKSEKNIKYIKMVLEYGADPNISENRKWTPLYMTIRFQKQPTRNENENECCASLLLKYGADPNIDPLFMSISYNKHYFTNILMCDINCDLNLKGWIFNESPLTLASRRNSVVVRMLLLLMDSMGEDPFENEDSFFNRYVSSFSSSKLMSEVNKVLISYGLHKIIKKKRK